MFSSLETLRECVFLISIFYAFLLQPFLEFISVETKLINLIDEISVIFFDIFNVFYVA